MVKAIIMYLLNTTLYWLKPQQSVSSYRIVRWLLENKNIYRESSGYDGPDLRCFEVTNATHKNIKNNIKRRK